MPPSIVTIIMYHYVRELKNSSYPKIKGLEFSLFQQQLDYLKKYYYFISMEELIRCYEDKVPPPEKSVLLTFDDGYSDHFRYVFPELQKRNIQGSFFVPAKPVLDNTVLDVNKIHYILACSHNDEFLVQKSIEKINHYRDEYQLQSCDYYFDKLAVATRFDSKEVAYFKRLLQKELPTQLRNIITTQLFEEIVGKTEQEFSLELYMSTSDLKEMLQNGMHIGHHGYNHSWLDCLSEEEQKIEIEKGYNFLNKLGVNMDLWTICYPYGAYSNSVIRILQDFNCKLGFTTKVDLANLVREDRFKLPRLDTNDIPKSNISLPNDWYLQISEPI